MKIGDSTKNLSGEQGLSEEKTKSDKQLTDDQLDSVAGGRLGFQLFPKERGKGFAGAEEKGKGRGRNGISQSGRKGKGRKSVKEGD